jgi:hypothetical protein
MTAAEARVQFIVLTEHRVQEKLEVLFTQIMLKARTDNHHIKVGEFGRDSSYYTIMTDPLVIKKLEELNYIVTKEISLNNELKEQVDSYTISWEHINV